MYTDGSTDGNGLLAVDGAVVPVRVEAREGGQVELGRAVDVPADATEGVPDLCRRESWQP